MATRVTEVGDGLISVERDGNTLTGVATGIPTNSFTIRKLASQRRDNGWVFRDDELGEWPAMGLIEHDGLIYAIGPAAPGIFVDEALRDEKRDRVEDLLTIASTFAALAGADVSIGQVHTRCMLLLDGGGALVLPPDISRTIREHQDLEGRLRTMQLFQHPDKSPVENVGFFLAVISYFVLTGRYPFEADAAEELHGRIRNGKPVAARHRRYTLKSDVSDFLSATLGGERYESSPSVWAKRLLSWSQKGFDGQLTDREREEASLQAEAEIQKLNRSFDRKESVRRNWRKWLIVAAMVVAGGSIPGTIVYNALQPRLTAGFLPDQVVTVFYTSINTLDHVVMEDAVVDRAGRPLIREVTNMFVIDRQRMAVEMRSSLVDAQTWRDQGMPPLEDGSVPYGVAHLSLAPMGAPAGEVAYRATYERWLPNPPESPEATVPVRPYIGYLVTDEIRLRQDREDWVIYEMISLSVEELDLDALLRETAVSIDSTER
ncbi:MAG: hypothetical protein V3S41_03785 [Spirochaetia bacterium]